MPLSTSLQMDAATWAIHFRTVSGLMRVLMTHALTRLDCIGNTAHYLKCRVSASTEEERKSAEAWRRMYVRCGCDHDPVTRLLMCEGECTCSEDSHTCVLGMIIAEVDNLVRGCPMHTLSHPDADARSSHSTTNG